jgi:nitrogen fixation protein NifU and related proteins
MPLKYTKTVMKNFLKPKNIGEMKDPDGFAEIGNPICGDMLTFAIKVKNDKITDIKFLSFGCAANIATTSKMTEVVKGMTLKDAKKVTMHQLADSLGGLPKVKLHCAAMALKGLHMAIEDYNQKPHGKTN